MDLSPIRSPDEAELVRLTQQIRATQARRKLPLVVPAAVVMLWTFWHDAQQLPLILWVAAICITSAVRWASCGRLLRALPGASNHELERNERWLLATGLVTALSVGSGLWWLGPDDEMLHALLLFCTMYAAGVMVTTSVHMRSYVLIVLAVMGPSIAYFSVVDHATGVAMLMVTLALIGLGRENARQFGMTIRTRLENVALVRRLEEEKQAVEAALVERNQLLRTASHDLRGRLSTLNLHLANLDYSLRGDTARINLDRTNAAAKGLDQLLGALLNVSALDGHRAEIVRHAFRIDALLDRIAATYRPKANLKGLELRVHSDPCTVWSNEAQVERVLENLVSNAIKYTVTGGIGISSSVEGPMVRILVEDSGIGIAAEDQERVFSDFVRLRNQLSDGEPGVGLGLAIVRRLDRALGLGLKLGSMPGRGSRFEFTLPRHAQEIDREPIVVPTARADRRFSVHICVIEDDPNIRLGLKEYLDSWGCLVQLALNRADLLTVLASPEDLPDLFLCDDMLGGPESGLELCKWLCMTVPQSHIVMMTGNVDTARTSLIVGSGFKLLTKPLSERVLLELLVQVEARVLGADPDHDQRANGDMTPTQLS